MVWGLLLAAIEPDIAAVVGGKQKHKIKGREYE